MIQCSGCGIRIQTEDPEQEGFAPVSSLKRDAVRCKRCFRMQHYGEIEKVSERERDYFTVFSSHKIEGSLIVQIVDLFNLEGSVLPSQGELESQKILVIGNKVDLFPRSVQRQKLEKVLHTFSVKHGLKALDVLLCSAETGRGMPEVYDKIQQYRQGRNVVVVGVANAGKSTFLNWIEREVNKNGTSYITTSPYPGTTRGAISIPLDDKHFLMDTPGYITQNSMSEWLTSEELKVVVPSTMIHPRVYQLHAKQTIFLGGFFRLDFLAGASQGFVVYVSNALYVHRTKLERADRVFEVQRGQLLIPPQDPSRLPEMQSYSFDLPGNEKKDIVVGGVGWITCQKECRVSVQAPRGIYVGVRRAII